MADGNSRLMLWEYATTDAVRNLPTNPLLEVFVAHEGGGALALSDRITANDRVPDRSLETVVELGETSSSAGPFLFMIRLKVPADWQQELIAWYRCEHGPILLECDDWCGFLVGRNTASDTEYFVVHRLNSMDALTSDARARARETPWFRRLQAHQWFTEPIARRLWRRR